MDLHDVEKISTIRGSETNYSVRLAVTLSTMMITAQKDAQKDDSVIVDVFWTKYMGTFKNTQKITCRVNSCAIVSQPQQTYSIDEIRQHVKAFFRVLGFVVGIL